MISGLSSLLGHTVFGHYSPQIIAATTAVAVGAILAMLADTMMPESFASAHDFAGILTVAGFLCAFMLSKSEEVKLEKPAAPTRAK